MPEADVDPGVLGDSLPLMGDAADPASMLVARPVRDTFSLRDSLPELGGAARENEARPDDIGREGQRDCSEAQHD